MIPPASTGSLRINKKAVIQTLNRKRDMLNQLNEGLFKLFTVHMKLIDLAMELTPAKCRLKITRSTVFLGVPRSLLRGGYRVHPTPGPDSIRIDVIMKVALNGINQNPRLFIRGKHMS